MYVYISTQCRGGGFFRVVDLFSVVIIDGCGIRLSGSYVLPGLLLLLAVQMFLFCFFLA